jgi:hypothetical protein
MNSTKKTGEEGKVRQLYDEAALASTAQTSIDMPGGDGGPDLARNTGCSPAISTPYTGIAGGGDMAGLERWLQAAKRHAEETRRKLQTVHSQPSPALALACREAMQKIVAMVNAEVSAAVSADIGRLKQSAALARQQAGKLRKESDELSRHCGSMPDFVSASPAETPALAWSRGDVVKLLLGTGLVALIAITEMLCICHILKEFTPGFGGNSTGIILKRLGIAFLGLGINLALEYTVLMEAKCNPRAEIYARRCAMTILVLAIVSFLGTLVYSGLPASGMTLTGWRDNSQMVSVLRVVSIFCGSFSAVFALAGIPIAEIARHHSPRRRNAEKMELKREIEMIEEKIYECLSHAEDAGQIEKQHEECLRKILISAELNVISSTKAISYKTA